MAHRVVMAAPKRFSVKGPPAKQVLASKDPLTTSRLEAWPGTAGSGGLGMLELRPKTGAARPHEEIGRLVSLADRAQFRARARSRPA